MSARVSEWAQFAGVIPPSAGPQNTVINGAPTPTSVTTPLSVAVDEVTAVASPLTTVAPPGGTREVASSRMLSKCERPAPRACNNTRIVLPRHAVLFGVSKTNAGASAKVPPATLA